MKTYTIRLTLEQADLLDIALSIAVKHAASGSKAYKGLQIEIERQLEEQD